MESFIFVNSEIRNKRQHKLKHRTWLGSISMKLKSRLKRRHLYFMDDNKKFLMVYNTLSISGKQYAKSFGRLIKERVKKNSLSL